jgi:hypothetical protein
MGTTTTEEMPQRFDLGSGFAFLWHQRFEIDEPEAYDVALELTVEEEGGRLVISSLAAKRRLGGPPVSIEMLKAMPLVRLAREAAHRAVTASPLSGLVRVEREGGPTGITTVGPANLKEMEELPEIERAAIAYRAAYFVGDSPTKAVAELLGLTHAVAAKRVQAARRAGLLEPTTQGRKGA